MTQLPSILFPCGCRITNASVLGMCPMHVVEFQQKHNAWAKEQEAFWRKLRGLETDSADANTRG